MSSEGQKNSLTNHFGANRISPEILDRKGFSMRGKVEEYRKGHFRVYFCYKGEKFFLYRYLDGTPLVHEFHAKRLLEHINALIDNHEFDPAEWRGDKPFLFEKAVEIWLANKHVTRETLDSRERITRLYLKPFFGKMDIRDIRRIHIEEFLSKLK